MKRFVGLVLCVGLAVVLSACGTVSAPTVTSPAIACGGFSLALKCDGSIWTWGSNSNGQLGDGTTTDRSTPVQVVGPGGSGTLTNVTAIATGEIHSLALKGDGSVWAWGSNGSGGLGDGTTTDRSTPVQARNLP